MSRFGGSKYKHIQGSIQKKELWYPDLKPSSGGSGEGTIIAASALWLSVAWSSPGAIAILSVDAPGKRKSIDLPMIHAHSSDIANLQWSPFSDEILASSADDGAIKLWKVPAGSSENISNPLASLSGHRRRVDTFKFHPTASNIIVSSGSDKVVKVWDVEASKDVLSMESLHTDVVYSIDWNHDGSLVATVSKDKKLRVIDPRTQSAVHNTDAHQGVKASRVSWLGNSGRIVTTGFSKFRERQFALWDSRDLSKPLCMPTLDSSTGVVDIFFDADTNLLFFAGKGDGNIKLIELNEPGTTPYYQELVNVSSDAPQKSTAMLPKRAVDLMNTEIVRLFKLTTNSVAPVSFSVPRKTKSEFQEDLYPPTASIEPALSASQWLAGENKLPNTVKLKPEANPHKFWEDANEPPKSEPVSLSSTPASESQSYISEQPKLKPADDRRASANFGRSQPSESQPSAPYVPKTVKVVRSSKFRHISGKGTKQEECYTNLKINAGANNSVIRANPYFFCVPWQGSGGLVGIIPLAKTGRLSDKGVPFIECGSPCLDFDFNPFNDNILATTTENAHLQIWEIPQGGLTGILKDPVRTLKGHLRRVTSVDFHPIISNIAVTAAGDNTIRLWDVEKGSETSKLDGPTDMVQSITWNWNGSVFAASSKDKSLTLFDPRSNTTVDKTQGVEGAKGFKSVWLGNRDKIASIGHSRTSERQINLFDTRKFSAPIANVTVDVGSGLITPFFDPDINVLYLAGKGDGNIKMYEIEEDAPYIHYLTDYTSTVPAQGIAILPKVSCNVRDCEIARFIKLCSDYAEPLSFKVPRTRMEYFQDDIYPPTRKLSPTQDAGSWLSGRNVDPELVSLRPADMKPLSDAPVEQKEKKYVFDPNGPKEELTREKVLDRFYQHMGSQKEEEKQVLKQDLMEGVDESEWD